MAGPDLAHPAFTFPKSFYRTNTLGYSAKLLTLLKKLSPLTRSETFYSCFHTSETFCNKNIRLQMQYNIKVEIEISNWMNQAIIISPTSPVGQKVLFSICSETLCKNCFGNHGLRLSAHLLIWFSLVCAPRIW